MSDAERMSEQIAAERASAKASPQGDHCVRGDGACCPWGVAIRSVECFLLFFVVPTVYALGFVPTHMILFLLGTTVFCAVLLLADGSFERERLWRPRALRPEVVRILLIFVVAVVAISVFVFLLKRPMLFSFVRRAPAIWAIVMVLYPLVSVYPQEMVYRTFFFHRYQRLFPNRWAMIAASAVAFGYMHIVFHNTLAVALTLAGGFLFALTYSRTRSTVAVAVEHALYGCFIFTIGLGRYFFHGSISLSHNLGGAPFGQ